MLLLIYNNICLTVKDLAVGCKTEEAVSAVYCITCCALNYISCVSLYLLYPLWTHQGFSHHHLDLLLSQHSKLSK